MFMNRRSFLKIGAVGLAGALEAEKEKGTAGRVNEKYAPVEIINHSPGLNPRVFFHCHSFPPNPQKFPSDPETGFFPGSIDHLSAFISHLGFDRATAISPFEVPPGRCTSRIGEGEDGLAWLESEAKGRKEIFLFAALNPQLKNSVERLSKAREKGFTGVKFHPPICRFSIDASRDREFYELLQSCRMPLLIHTGVFSSPEPWPLEEYHPLRIDRMANLFPGIPVILAHGGGRAFCREELAVFQANPNTYLDLTHTLDKKYAWHIPTPDLEAFFDQLGSSRIIYGADYPWFTEDDYRRDLNFLKALGLEEKDFELVLGGTFMQILEKAGR